MVVGIGGGGFVGVALEATPNTYLAPTKFFPLRSEGLHHVQDTQWRRTIRKNVDVYGAVPGNVHIEGDIEIECLEDALVYFMYASRCTIVKSGTAPNFTYTAVGNANAVPTKTLSITVVRNNVVFGYVGLVVSSFTFGIDSGLLTYSASLVGSDEASQSLPVPTFSTSTPFGAGMYTVEIPAGTQIFDADTFEFQVEDNAEPQYRLKSGGARGAHFVKYGERNTRMSTSLDFHSRAQYDNYKALTSEAVSILASRGVNNQVKLEMLTAIKDGYDLALPGQGDLVRATTAYQGIYDSATDSAYRVTVKTQEDITP